MKLSQNKKKLVIMAVIILNLFLLFGASSVLAESDNEKPDGFALFSSHSLNSLFEKIIKSFNLRPLPAWASPDILCQRCSTIYSYTWARWFSGPDNICDTADDRYGTVVYTCDCSCPVRASDPYNCTGQCFPPTLVIKPASATVYVGQKQQFLGLYDPDGPSGSKPEQDVTTNSGTNWTSDNSSIATVNNSTQKGLATGISVGSTKIWASYSGIRASATIEVKIEVKTVKATVSWGPTPNATYYNLRIDDPTSAVSPDISIDNYTSTSYTFSAAFGKTYNWWVHACNAYGCSQPTSSSLTCTTVCNSYSFQGGSISPSSVNPGGSYSMSCNYGRAGIDCINITPPSGSCSFTGWSGTTATFSCTAGSDLGTFNGYCRTIGGTSSNCCPNTNFAGTLTVVLPQYTLTVTKSGTGSGTVTSNPAGINCGFDCSEPYTSGTSVTLTATASVASGSTFAGWSGEGCSGTGTCTVSMTQNRNVTATFNVVALPTLSVTLTANPSSGNAPLNNVVLTADPSGTAIGTINYTFYCNRSDSGTNITAGYAHKLDGTNSDPYSAPAGICNSVYANAGTYTAKVIVERGSLAAEARQTVTVSSLPSPPTVDIKASGSDGPISIAYNTAATLSWTSTNATACTASNGWSGSKPTSGSESTGNLTSSKTYTLTCTGSGGSASDSVMVSVANYGINVRKSGTGTGTVTSNPLGINCGPACSFQYAPFSAGTWVALTPSASAGSTFAGWGDECAEGYPGTRITGTTCEVLIYNVRDRNVSATFNLQIPTPKWKEIIPK